MSARAQRRERLADLALFAALLLLTRLPDLFFHYRDWDEAEMMSEAWAMTQGEVLHRDIIHLHPLLQFALFVPFFLLLPPDAAPHAVKGFNALLALGGAWLARGLVRSWNGDAGAARAAGLLLLWLLGRPWALSSYGEFYTLFPALLSLWLLGLPRPPFAVVGALWGAAFFVKQTAAFDAAALAAGWWLLRRPRRAEALVAAARAAAGACAVAAAVAAYFLAHGALGHALDALFVRPFAYRLLPGMPLPERAAHFAARMALPLLRDLAPALLAAGAGLAAARGRVSPPARLCLLWLAAGAACVWSLGKMHPHYGLALVAPAALLAGALLGEGAPWRRHVSRALSALLLAAGLWTGAPAVAELARAGWRPEPVAGSQALAQAVRRHSAPGERVFVYGVQHLDVFYLAERAAAGGVYNYMAMEEWFVRDATLVSRQRAALAADPPALLVVNGTGRFPASPESRAFFAALMRDRYVRVESVGLAELWRRR